MEAAWQNACTCPTFLEFARALTASVEWHDLHERLCKSAKETIGEFAKCLYFDSFSDRKENIFAIGMSGSGKSTVLGAFENILSANRVFSPVYESSAPFSALRPHHLLGSFQEFRCVPQINPATLLLLTERRPNLQVNVKHEEAVVIPNGGPRCILSANYLKTCAGWNDEDIEALYDRGMVFWWHRKLPQEMRTQASRNKCKKCSIAFVAQCSPPLRAHLENKLGPLTAPHQ